MRHVKEDARVKLRANRRIFAKGQCAIRMNESDRLALETLRWYQAMGVDEAIADDPLNWTQFDPESLAIAPAEEATRPRQPPVAPSHTRLAPEPAEPRTPAPMRVPPPLLDPSAMEARELASAAPDLGALEATLFGFNGCALKKTAKNLCFARGNPQARLMCIGEAPGRDEDLEGAPFVGRAGQLLDRMLAAIGLGRDDAYITNVVYWRPPGNRTPTPQEVQACRPFLERQIELVGPEILLLLGGAAGKQVLGTDQGIMKLRGKWKEYDAGGRAIRAMATLHPAFLLRNPISKRQAWRDLLMVQAALEGGK
jgi:uracil-DNA glycosylase family 4